MITLWQESLPRSSRPRSSLCLISPPFTLAIHFSRDLFNYTTTLFSTSLGTKRCPRGVIFNPTVYLCLVVNYDFSYFSSIIPVVLPSSSIKIRGKTVKRLMSYDRTNKWTNMQTNRDYNFIKIDLKELSLWHKLNFYYPYIFATWWWRPLIFQTYLLFIFWSNIVHRFSD